MRVLCSLFLLFSTTAYSATNELPDLGDRTSSYVSLQQEHQLGRLWLRQLRAQAPTIDTPLATTFIEHLIYRLVPHSEIKQSELEFVIVDQPELNAFAVPGGIIGINYGLLLFSDDEDEISGVLAHELAHLSQRHFARQIERAEQQQPIAIATLLASILLIATSNSDAGFAGLVSSQAASIQDRLSYSRAWEREADRIGIKTLAGAGLDPYAMPTMFQQMLAAGRFSQRPPEFLLTHPVTESRVADAAGRAANYPRQPRNLSYEFLILKYDAERRYRLSSVDQHITFEQRLTDSEDTQRAALLYSLADIALSKRNYQDGLNWLQQIPTPWLTHSATLVLKAKLLAAQGNQNAALAAIHQGLKVAPDDYPLRYQQAMLLLTKEANSSVEILRQLTEERPSNVFLWRSLAEAGIAAKQKLIAYRANGEYLFMTGQQAKALRQMELAIEEARKAKDFQQEAAITARLRAMAATPTKFGL